MKQCNIDKASRLADERFDLFTLRTSALTHPVTVSAGTSPMEIPHALALELLDALIRANALSLKELGVTDISEWRMPARPPEAE
jgi:hypothetical protein